MEKMEVRIRLVPGFDGIEEEYLVRRSPLENVFMALCVYPTGTLFKKDNDSDMDDLWKLAEKNTQKDFHHESMANFLQNFSDEFEDYSEEEIPELHILTNHDLNYGAGSVIFNAKNFCDKMNIKKLLLVPSSEHEFLGFDISNADSREEDIKCHQILEIKEQIDSSMPDLNNNIKGIFIYYRDNDEYMLKAV